ncbi:MAG: substrate-binding domain-containing protein [Treponema sp.]|nr:substrate-binding domain-containing protein [Treponema sp.]
MARKQPNFILLILISFILPVIFALTIFHTFKRFTMEQEIPQRRNHIIVIGKTASNNFLNNVYIGADKVSERYNAVVELYVPSSKAEDTSLQALFDYATFVNADGIIAYIDNESDIVETPTGSGRTQIPVVTVGHFNQNIPQISFIGNNFSESGRILAKTAFEYSTNESALYIVNSSTKTQGYSTLLNSLSVTLRGFQMNTTFLEGSAKENEDFLMPELFNKQKHNIIISLSEDDTIRISQLSSDTLYNENNTIISFGNNDTISTYLEKGIVSAIISVDQEKTGTLAMKELFDYKRTNFANNYVYAGLQLIKKENKK